VVTVDYETIARDSVFNVSCAPSTSLQAADTRVHADCRLTDFQSWKTGADPLYFCMCFCLLKYKRKVQIQSTCILADYCKILLKVKTIHKVTGAWQNLVLSESYAHAFYGAPHEEQCLGLLRLIPCRARTRTHHARNLARAEAIAFIKEHKVRSSDFVNSCVRKWPDFIKNGCNYILTTWKYGESLTKDFTLPTVVKTSWIQPSNRFVDKQPLRRAVKCCVFHRRNNLANTVKCKLRKRLPHRLTVKQKPFRPPESLWQRTAR